MIASMQITAVGVNDPSLSATFGEEFSKTDTGDIVDERLWRQLDFIESPHK